MLSDKRESAELVRILINSTCTYMALHISNEKNRFAYVRAMSRCLNVCSERYNRNDTNRMRSEILKLKKDSLKNLTPRFEIFARTNRYYKLGIGQSLDIIESIQRRFENGGSYADEYFVKSILKGTKNED